MYLLISPCFFEETAEYFNNHLDCKLIMELDAILRIKKFEKIEIYI